jgi:phosphomannomutase
MAGAALILQSLAEEEASLSQKVSTFPRYFIVKEKSPLKADVALSEKRLRERFSGRLNAIDGMRIDMENGWIHVRRSNTEPIVRIIAEARSLEEAQNLANEAGKLLM